MNPSPVQYQNAGNYPVSLVVTNSSGCRDSVSTNIDAYPIPVVSAGPIRWSAREPAACWTLLAPTPTSGHRQQGCSHKLQNPIATPAVETQILLRVQPSTGAAVLILWPFLLYRPSRWQPMVEIHCVGKSTRMAAWAHHSSMVACRRAWWPNCRHTHRFTTVYHQLYGRWLWW